MPRPRVDILTRVQTDAARVRKAQADLDRVRALLVETIRQARASGKVLREIGEASGLSVQRVAQMTGEPKASEAEDDGGET